MFVAFYLLFILLFFQLKRKLLDYLAEKGTLSNKKRLPWGWYLFLTLVLLVGVALVWINPRMPTSVATLSRLIRPESWSRIVGILLIAVPTTHIVVFSALLLANWLFETDISPVRRDLWPPALVGLLESIMYPTALLLNAKEYIGLWLLLKVAGQWPRWGLQSNADNAALNAGRRRYFLFLIGSALQVILGLLTYAVAKECVLTQSNP